MSNFKLPDELIQFKDMLRRFVDRELIPHEGKVQSDGTLPLDLQEELKVKAKNSGIWHLDVPEEYGGQGLGMLAMSVFWEEISRTTAVPARDYSIFGGNIGPILMSLNESQRQKYLLPVLEGSKRACFAQTEPDAGSDPSAMRTRAERTGNGYVINGVKRFITGASEADFAQVAAITAPGAGGKAISFFLVDMNTKGLSITSRQETMMGEKPCELTFDNVFVPEENLVGEEGGGVSLARNWISHGRIRHGARGCGVAMRCLELAIDYAKQRVTFGSTLSERQGVQWMLANAYMDTYTTRLLVQEAADLVDRGEDARTQTFMVKILGDEMSFKVADVCMQLHGGMGLTTDLPIERFWRDQRSFLITEGPNEVLRTALARDILKRFDSRSA
jgi:acyl-CoA dehydrogenase